MDLTLVRHTVGQDGIFGELSESVPHIFEGPFAVTLEHAYLVIDELSAKVSFSPKIPEGVYTCKRYMSPKHGYEVFRLLAVPGSDYDEIHIGNYNSDSDGCILIGNRVISEDAPAAITGSRVTFKKLMDLQEGIDQFTLTVRNS